MFRKPRPKDVVVVALDLNRKDPEFAEYEQLTASRKLQHLIERVYMICEKLAVDEPKSAWVIAWREYGITEAGDSARSVSTEFKNEFKRRLSQITDDYPNLTVVAGTLSVAKEISPDRLDKITRYYAEHGDLVNIETQSSTLGSDMQYKGHLDKHAKVMESMQDIAEKGHAVISIRNTCYIFQGGSDSQVMRHSKVAPQNETEFNTFVPLTNVVFQPGHGRSKLHSFPVAASEKSKMIVEICREHDLGSARLERQREQRNPELLHFVLSDSVSLNMSNVDAGYLVQMDSIVRPKLIKTSMHQNNMPNVRMYYCNALQDTFSLSSAIKPIRLFEARVLDEFDIMLDCVSTTKQREIIKLIRQEFIKEADAITSDSMHNLLEKTFSDTKILNALLKPQQSQKTGGKQHIFTTPISFLLKTTNMVRLASSIKKVLSMVGQDRKKNPVYKDYMSRRPPNEF